MNITTQITPRDKVLLVILAAFLLVAGIGWFIIRPLLADITDLESKIMIADSLKKQNDYSISNISDYEAALESANATLIEDAKPYYDNMASQEIDRLLTLEALNYGFDKSDLRELSINVPSDFLMLMPYMAADDTEDTGEIIGVYGATASFTLHGTREMLEKFCDKLANEYSGIQIASLVWGKENKNDTAYLLTVQLRILMTDSSEITANVPELGSTASVTE